MKKKRYLPHREFPSYIFIPGKNPHPKKLGGHMEGEEDPIAPVIDPGSPGDNEFLRFSIDLFNHGYFWESHVYLEALWNSHEREGSIADLLKGLIKLSAAGVKVNLDQMDSALGHLDRARELFQDVMKREGSPFLGFDLSFLLSRIAEVSISGQPSIFEIHPIWE